MGKIQKVGRWMPHELNERQRRRGTKTHVKFCSNDTEESHSCIVLLLEMKSGFFFRIPSANIIGKPRRTIHIDRIALAGRRCSVFDGTRRVYYELLKPGETVNTKRYQQQLIDLFKKRPEYQKRQHKAIFLHDNAPSYMAKPVRDTLEALSWEILPPPMRLLTRLGSFRLLLVCIDGSRTC